MVKCTFKVFIILYLYLFTAKCISCAKFYFCHEFIPSFFTFWLIFSTLSNSSVKISFHSIFHIPSFLFSYGPGTYLCCHSKRSLLAFQLLFLDFISWCFWFNSLYSWSTTSSNLPKKKKMVLRSNLFGQFGYLKMGFFYSNIWLILIWIWKSCALYRGALTWWKSMIPDKIVQSTCSLHLGGEWPKGKFRAY